MPIPVVFRASSPDGSLESFGINQETTVTATTTVTVAASNDLFMTVSTYFFLKSVTSEKNDLPVISRETS